MRKIHLYGDLAKHGDVFDLDVMTAGEAVMALCTIMPPIMEDLRKGSWILMAGDRETGLCLEEEAISSMLLGSNDLHIMPEIMGAKSGRGALKAVLGVALIAVSFGSAAFLSAPISASLMAGTTWGNVIGQLGLTMALSGVSTMLAGETETDSSDENKSYTLSGPVSQIAQGVPVQIIYGEVITGGMMISGGIDADGLEKVVEEVVPPADPAVVEENPWNVPDR